MKKLLSYLVIAAAIFSTACKKESKSESEDELYTVSGYVYTDGKPVSGVKVNIDNLEQYKTSTDEKGYFSIQKVSKRTGNLNAEKTLDNGSNGVESFPIEVKSDMVLNDLKLPNPVSIVSNILDSTINKVTVVWQKSISDEFREYKLYSHTSPGLDESTGTLEYVGTGKNDTAFTFTVASNQSFYFRVYVMDDFGKLGGSNIVSLKSSNPNLIGDGSFDQQNSLANWSTTGNFSIDETILKAGFGSLKITGIVDSVNNSKSSPAVISKSKMSVPISLNQGKDYEISFWYLASGVGYMMYPLNLSIKQDNSEKYFHTFNNSSEFSLVWIPQSPNAIIEAKEWKFYKEIYTANSSSYATFEISTQLENVWIDDLKIKIIE